MIITFEKELWRNGDEKKQEGWGVKIMYYFDDVYKYTAH